MKRLNRIEKIIGSLTLVVAIIIQCLIFFEHGAGWYRDFYNILNVIGVGLLVCIGYCLLVMLKCKRFVISGIMFPCMGLVFSIQQYKSAIEHINPSESFRGMSYFALGPFMICIALSLIVFLYNYFWTKKVASESNS